jgi:hypothetical protein
VRQIVRQNTEAQDIKQPIQLWLPWLADNLSSREAQRDARRAMEVWKGELKVWLLPELKKPVRWYEGKGKIRFPVLAIPAEHTDRLSVYHIGSNGQVCGPASHSLSPMGLDGLLDAWLNLNSLEGGIKFYGAPETITIEVPRVTKKGVRYRNSEFRLVPGPTWPIVGVDDKSRVVKIKWPPDAMSVGPVSPEAESAEHYGPLRRADQEGVPTAISYKDPTFRSLHTICMLPKPLEQLAPFGVGIDTLFGQAQMARFAQLSATDRTEALKKAREAARIYLDGGQTTQELAWIFPTIQEKGVDGGLQAAWFRLNLKDHRTLEGAMNSPAWRAEAMKLVPIRRAWGVLGLFWSLLLDRLDGNEIFNICEHCGRIITARKGKRFCGNKDNLVCYRTRRTADRRRERSRACQAKRRDG